MDVKEVSILFVEDDQVSRELVLDFLEQEGYKTIYVAKNGEEGLEKYFHFNPDLVITDLHMPIIDGLEMSEKIKADNSNKPILLITSHFEQYITERAVDIGIDAYLFKPISLERFKKVLSKYMKRILIEQDLKNKHKLLSEYKNAIDVSAAVTKTDPNGIIIYVNEAFCEMSGFSNDELIDRSHNIIKEPNSQDNFFKEMWATISSKRVWQGRMKNIKKNGEVYYVQSSIVPILDENEEIVEYIAFSHDITDILMQEELLKKRIKKEVNKNLELHKKREEENLLEAKFSTIGRMAAGITHEINTPLTYAKGNLELMIQDINNLDDNIKQKDYLLEDSQTVLEGINRIAGIVESMREMASHSEEDFMYHNLYSSLITALILANNKAKHVCEIRIQNETFKLGMDKKKLNYPTMVQRQRIEQVFVIIINNALDALLHISDFHARLLEITIENEHDFIVIRFKDNGGGIDKNILPKIFDPFQSNKKEGGMGIGLNVAKRIVTDHNGKIIPYNYESGAIFEILLPKISPAI